MKVCVLSASSFEKNYSSYHLMRDLICEMLNEGNSVQLVQKNSGNVNCLPKELENKDDFTVCNIYHKPAQKSNLIMRILVDIRYYLKTSTILKKSKDCGVFFLQSNNVPWLPVWLIKHIAHKPVVYNVQDIFPQNAIYSGILPANSVVCKVLLKLQKYALKKSDSIITISEDMKETLIGAGADSEKISVAYNWKNDINNPSEKIIKTNDGKFHVVYAGNIGRMQNVEVIIRAAALLVDNKDIQFDIYGNGVLKEKCVTLASELKAINVIFHEPVPADQAYQLYENADLNIVPLAENIIKTALPSKTATCLSCNKPIIFAIGEDSIFAKRLSEQTGALVTEPDDAEALSSAILKIYEGKTCSDSYRFYQKYFLKSVNSKAYAEIICK